MQMLNQRHSVIWFKIHCCLGTRQLLWAALVPLILTLNECCEIWLHPTLAIKVWATMTWGTLIIWRTKPRWTPRMLLAGKIERYKSRLTTCQSRHFSNFSLVAILKQLLHNNNKSNALVLFSQAGLLYATEKLFNAFWDSGGGTLKGKRKEKKTEKNQRAICRDFMFGSIGQKNSVCFHLDRLTRNIFDLLREKGAKSGPRKNI